MNSGRSHSQVFSLSMLLAGFAVASVAQAQLTFSQSSVFTGGIKTNGSAVNSQAFAGATATFTYSAVDSFTINAATNFTALPLTSLFSGTDNTFGVYDYGFTGTTGSNAYFTGTGAGANAAYAVRLSPLTGFPSLTLSGGFTSSSSTQADNAVMTWAWKIVQFDGASTYTVLDSGAFTSTAISGTTSLSGTTAFNNTTTSLAGAGAWVGLFVQGSNPTGTSGGQHFNAALNLSVSAIPEPAATALVLGAGGFALAVVGVRRRRLLRVACGRAGAGSPPQKNFVRFRRWRLLSGEHADRRRVAPRLRRRKIRAGLWRTR